MSPSQLPPSVPVPRKPQSGRGRWERSPEQHARNVAFGVKHAAYAKDWKLKHDAGKG